MSHLKLILKLENVYLHHMSGEQTKKNVQVIYTSSCKPVMLLLDNFEPNSI